MNLDELKHIWKEGSAAQQVEKLEAQEILGLLKGKSQSLLNKINRNILIEMGVVVLLTLFFLFNQQASEGGVSAGEWWLSLGYVLFSAVFYGIKYQSLNHGKLRTRNLKSALKHIVRVMRIYMNIYYWSSYLLLPALSSLGFFMGLTQGLAENGKTLADLSPERWGLVILILGIFNFIGIGLVRLYVRWLYGRHYKELKACLQELDENQP
jgi:hypothetical protein